MKSSGLFLQLLVACLLGFGAWKGAPASRPAPVHPDISIVGVPKCGTSHMYTILRTHRATMALAKEWCPANVTFQALSSYARKVDKRLRAAQGLRSVAACIDTEKSYRFYMHAKQRSPGISPKFIYMIRDPAELLWASYNFWSMPGDTKEDTLFRWTRREHSYRSPQHFHELLLSEGRILGGMNLTQEFFRQRYSLPYLDALISEAGRDNVMIVEASRLEAAEVDNLLKDLAKFTRLSLVGFNKKSARSTTNSGFKLGSRGVWAVTNERKAGVYEISGYKPMLEASRELILGKAYPFCQHVREKYQVTFHACLAQGAVQQQIGDGAL